MRRVIAAAVALTLALPVGCDAPAPAEGPSFTSEYVDVEPVEVLWEGELLRAPFDIIPLGADELLVLDADALFAIPRNGGDARPIGGRGGGPGEFMSVTGGEVTPGGGAVIVDGSLRRATYLDPAGGYIRSVNLGAPPNLGSLVQGPVLPTTEGLLGVRWAFGLVDTDGPRAPTGLASHDSTGAPELLADWEGLGWIDSPWMPMPSGPAAHEPPFATSTEEGVAYWLSDEARCIDRIRLRTGERLQPVCPPFTSVPMLPYVPTESEIEEAGHSGVLAEVLLGKHEVQDFSGDYPPIQRLLTDSQGCLWMRIVKDDAPYDPMIQAQLPSTRPAAYEWWVVEPESSEVAARLLVPERFRPRLIRPDAIVGLLEQADYTLVPSLKRFNREGWERCG